ncbi:MAG: hypothetical protein RRZ24_05490 [Clostridia bacterium]
MQAKILKRDGMTFTIDELRYAAGREIEYDLTIVNNDSKMTGLTSLGTYLKQWLVTSDQFDIVMLASGEPIWIPCRLWGEL